MWGIQVVLVKANLFSPLFRLFHEFPATVQHEVRYDAAIVPRALSNEGHGF